MTWVIGFNAVLAGLNAAVWSYSGSSLSAFCTGLNLACVAFTIIIDRYDS